MCARVCPRPPQDTGDVQWGSAHRTTLLTICPWSPQNTRVCSEAVQNNPWMLLFVPDHLKMQEMCIKILEKNPRLLWYVPDQFKTQRTCERALWLSSSFLQLVPDQYVKQEVCADAVRDEPFSLQYVPDWFLTQQQIKIWHDDDYYCNYDKFIRWYNGCKKRKPQKAKIKDELCLLPGIYQGGEIFVFLRMRKKKQKHRGARLFDMLELKCTNKRRCWNLVKKRLKPKTFMDKDT